MKDPEITKLFDEFMTSSFVFPEDISHDDRQRVAETVEGGFTAGFAAAFMWLSRTHANTPVSQVANLFAAKEMAAGISHAKSLAEESEARERMVQARERVAPHRN